MMVPYSQLISLSLAAVALAINIPRLADHGPQAQSRAFARIHRDSQNKELEPRYFKELGSKRVLMKYGPYTVPPSTENNGMKEFTDPANEKPCSDCLIIGIQAGLEYPNGTIANSNSGMWLHHGVLYDFGRIDTVCPSMPYRFFASGNERTPLDLSANGTSKTGFPMLGSSSMGTTTELMNELPYEREAVLTIDFEYIPGLRKDFRHLDTIWLDVTGVCGDSDIAVPPGQQTFVYTTPDITVKSTGNIVAAGGHLHDGGSLCRITQNRHTLCDFTAFYGQTEGYIDYIGTSHMARAGPGAPSNTGPREPMTHISSMPLCYKPGNYSANDTFGIIAHYNATAHPLMIGGKTGLEPVMGISILYLDNLSPVGPVLVEANVTGNGSAPPGFTLSATSAASTFSSTSTLASVSSEKPRDSSALPSSSIINSATVLNATIPGTALSTRSSAGATSLAASKDSTSMVTPGQPSAKPTASTSFVLSVTSTTKASRTSSTVQTTPIAKTSTTWTTSMITTAASIPTTSLPITSRPAAPDSTLATSTPKGLLSTTVYTIPAGAVITIATIYTSTVTMTSTTTSTSTISTVYIKEPTSTITEHTTQTEISVVTSTNILTSTATKTSTITNTNTLTQTQSTTAVVTTTATAYIISSTVLTTIATSTFFTKVTLTKLLTTITTATLFSRLTSTTVVTSIATSTLFTRVTSTAFLSGNNNVPVSVRSNASSSPSSLPVPSLSSPPVSSQPASSPSSTSRRTSSSSTLVSSSPRSSPPSSPSPSSNRPKLGNCPLGGGFCIRPAFFAISPPYTTNGAWSTPVIGVVEAEPLRETDAQVKATLTANRSGFFSPQPSPQLPSPIAPTPFVGFQPLRLLHTLLPEEYGESDRAVFTSTREAVWTEVETATVVVAVVVTIEQRLTTQVVPVQVFEAKTLAIGN